MRDWYIIQPDLLSNLFLFLKLDFELCKFAMCALWAGTKRKSTSLFKQYKFRELFLFQSGIKEN